MNVATTSGERGSRGIEAVERLADQGLREGGFGAVAFFLVVAFLPDGARGGGGVVVVGEVAGSAAAAAPAVSARLGASIRAGAVAAAGGAVAGVRRWGAREKAESSS